jgi:cytochrome c-type biogenesis protein CcmH/NrfG
LLTLPPMALSRSSVNLIFGAIVAALAITAGAFIYQNSSQPETQPQPEQAQIHQNTPPIDLANRVTALEQLAAREPQNAEYPTQIGNLYYDAGEYGKAADYYQRSLNLHPRDPNVETDLATCLHYLGQEDKALELLDNVLSYSPGFTQAKFNKGIVLIEGKKDVKNGIAVWEDLLRSDPTYSQRTQLEQRIRQLKESSQ